MIYSWMFIKAYDRVKEEKRDWGIWQIRGGFDNSQASYLVSLSGRFCCSSQGIAIRLHFYVSLKSMSVLHMSVLPLWKSSEQTESLMRVMETMMTCSWRQVMFHTLGPVSPADLMFSSIDCERKPLSSIASSIVLMYVYCHLYVNEIVINNWDIILCRAL